MNLSDPAGEKEYNKPTIKLSYDPAERDIGADGSTSEPPTTKKHVSGTNMYPCKDWTRAETL